MNIVVAGGGTGGHLFPGIAAAEGIQGSRRDIRVAFICTQREFDRIEMRKRGLSFVALPSPSGAISPRSVGRFSLRLCESVLRALSFYRRFRPAGVLCVGGYGSFPPAVAASLMGIPYAVMEQNAVPGKTNRLLARNAAALFSQWAEAKSYFRQRGVRFFHTGSPLRMGMKKIDRREAKRMLGFDPSSPLLVVIGGSQGAESLNAMVLGDLDELRGTKGLQILHLTGQRDEARMREAYERGRIRAKAMGFCDTMDVAYSAADVVLSRAGALAIAEIAFFGVPPLLVPYPHAADNHQSANASVLAREGAALTIEERDYKKGQIGKSVGKMIADRVLWEERSTRLRRFVKPNARGEIAERFLSMLSGRGRFT